MPLYATVSSWIKETPDHLNTQKMCKKVVKKNSYTLKFVLDYLKTKEMCEKILEDDPDTLTPWNLFLITLRRKICVKELLRKTHGHCYMMAPIGL